MTLSQNIEIKSALSNAADTLKGAASFSIVLIILSIIYEYFYFIAIDTHILQLYSTTDFIKLTVAWLPAMILGSSLGLLLNYNDMRARREAFEKFGEAGLNVWKGPDRFMNYAFKLIILISLITMPFLNWDNFRVLQIPLYFLIATYVLKNIFGKNSANYVFSGNIYMILILIFLSVSAAFTGLSDCYNDFEKKIPDYELSLEDKAQKIVLIRSLDKGVLAKMEGKNQLQFISWDKVKSLTSNEILFSKKHLYMRIYEWCTGRAS